MRILYHISSYDKKTDAQVEQIPVSEDIFLATQALAKDLDADCIRITPDIYKFLGKQFSMTLSLDKADYFLERCGDYAI